MPYRHLYNGTTCTSILTNEEMIPLIYLCLLCVIVSCSWDWARETRSIYKFYMPLSWEQGTGKRIWQSVDMSIQHPVRDYIQETFENKTVLVLVK